jgi:hypothetical protein
MLTDGTVQTFKTDSDPSYLKGKLVNFAQNEDGSVTLDPVNYPSQPQVNVDKENKRILYGGNDCSNDVASNVKIYNIISGNEYNQDDTEAEMLNWSRMPSGLLSQGKIRYLNKTGIFEDINIIVLNNIKDDNVRIGIIKGISKSAGNNFYNYTIDVDGKDYSYSNGVYSFGLGTGTAVKVILSDSTIREIVEVIEPDISSKVIQSVDMQRLRANNRTYEIADSCKVYLMKGSGTLKKINISDMLEKYKYGEFYVYTDLPFVYGGKAELIVIKG